MREKLEAVSSEVCKVSKSHEVEAAERQNFLLGLQQYGTQIQRGISVLLQVAQEANIRSDAGLDNLAISLAEDNRVPISADPTEKDEVVQCDDSLVRRQSTKRSVDGLRTMDAQPVAMPGNHLFQKAQPFCHGLRDWFTAVALLNAAISTGTDPGSLYSRPMSQKPAESLEYEDPSLLLDLH